MSERNDIVRFRMPWDCKDTHAIIFGIGNVTGPVSVEAYGPLSYRLSLSLSLGDTTDILVLFYKEPCSYDDAKVFQADGHIVVVPLDKEISSMSLRNLFDILSYVGPVIASEGATAQMA